MTGRTFVPACGRSGRRCDYYFVFYYARRLNAFQLDEEGMKEKKKQKLMKAGFEARARARREKEREREEKEKEERREEEERLEDLDGWGRRKRQEHEV